MKLVSKKMLFSSLLHGQSNFITTREGAVVLDCKLEVTGPESAKCKSVFLFVLEDDQRRPVSREFHMFSTDQQIYAFDGNKRYWHIATIADKGATGYGQYMYDSYHTVWELK